MATSPAATSPTAAPAKTAPPAAAAPTKAGPKTATAPASPPKPKYLEPLAANAATSVLGKKVVGPNGEDVGLIVDIVVDARGCPEAAIIDLGGFLGVGNRKIAVDWRLLSFMPGNSDKDKQVWLSLPRTEIQAAPQYKPDDPWTEMVGPPPPDAAASADATKK
jgi:hypothetical protein